MTNDQLQHAIECALKVVEKEVKYNDEYKVVKAAATSHLTKLYAVQATRAAAPILVQSIQHRKL